MALEVSTPRQPHSPFGVEVGGGPIFRRLKPTAIHGDALRATGQKPELLGERNNSIVPMDRGTSPPSHEAPDVGMQAFLGLRSPEFVNQNLELRASSRLCVSAVNLAGPAVAARNKPWAQASAE